MHQMGLEPMRSYEQQISSQFRRNCSFLRLKSASLTNSDTDARDSGGGRTRNLGMAPGETMFRPRSPTRYPISPQSLEKIFLNITKWLCSRKIQMPTRKTVVGGELNYC